MGMMDMMVKGISKDKREQMMINMMPRMMEGIDIYEFMPKMMSDMLKDVTVDDVIAFIKRAIEDQDKLKELADKIAQANLMQQMMFKVYTSKLGFDETVSTVAQMQHLDAAGKFPTSEIYRRNIRMQGFLTRQK